MAKSKMNPMPDGTDYFSYMRIVRESRLLALEKNLLYFYAGAYNWEKHTPSFYEEERVAAHTGMSVSTVHKKRKRLAELGWIVVKGGGYRKTPHIFISIGSNDPKFEEKECSLWKPENRALSNAEISALSPDEIDLYFQTRQGRRKRSA